MKTASVCVRILCFLTTVAANPTANPENGKIYKTYAEQHTQFISSPRSPLQYPTNSDVYYKIIQSPVSERKSNFYLEIRWLEFNVGGDTQGCSDFVQVRYANRSQANLRFCSQRKPHDIYSLEDEIELHFHSDQSSVGYGFKFAYRLVPFHETIGSDNCRTEVDVEKPLGIISSTRWPATSNHSYCVYRFALRADEELQIGILDFDMGSDRSADCNRYNAFVEIRGTNSNRTFTESCPIKFLSSCDQISHWVLHLKQRTIFVHVNMKDNSRNGRGFLAGFNIYKITAKSHVASGHGGKRQRRVGWVSDAVMIGAVTGVIIGLSIVLLTIFSVSVCMKKGIL